MYDVYGTICNTYEEACIVAGVDTPAQIEAEIRYDAMVYEIENLKRPVGFYLCTLHLLPGQVYDASRDEWTGFADEIPF